MSAGGLIGVLITAVLAKFKVGLSKKPSPTAEVKQSPISSVLAHDCSDPSCNDGDDDEEEGDVDDSDDD